MLKCGEAWKLSGAEGEAPFNIAEGELMPQSIPLGFFYHHLAMKIRKTIHNVT